MNKMEMDKMEMDEMEMDKMEMEMEANEEETNEEETNKDAGEAFLNDKWMVQGKDLDTFALSLRDLERATKYAVINTADLSVLRKGYESKDKYHFVHIDDQTVYQFEETMAVDEKWDVPKESVNQALLSSSNKDIGFILKYGDEILYPASGSMPSLLTKCKGLNGKLMYKHSLIRDLHLMEGLRKAGIESQFSNNCTIVYREAECRGVKCRKAFYFGSEKYQRIRISTLADMAGKVVDNPDFGEDTDDSRICGWEIDHGRAEITFVFPKMRDEIQEAYHLKDSILPGLILTSSDTGEVCMTAKAIAYLRGSGQYIELEKVPMKHIGKVNEEKFLEDANDMIFRNYRKLPELLCALMEKSLFTGHERSDKSKRRIIESAYTKCIKGCYYGPSARKGDGHRSLKSIIGENREKAIRAQMFAEIDTDAVWTYYDIVMDVMSISDRMTVTPSMKETLPVALSKAPYVFESLVKAGGKGEDDDDAILFP